MPFTSPKVVCKSTWTPPPESKVMCMLRWPSPLKVTVSPLHGLVRMKVIGREMLTTVSARAGSASDSAKRAAASGGKAMKSHRRQERTVGRWVFMLFLLCKDQRNTYRAYETQSYQVYPRKDLSSSFLQAF